MAFTPPAESTLVRTLGAGSMFEVAVVSYLGEHCVCKRLRTSVSGELAAQKALVREETVLNLVQHPSLPRLVAGGEDAVGPYVLQTWFEAVSLRDLSEAWHQRAGKMPEALQLTLAIRAFTALAEVHGLTRETEPLALVHGDLSPDHVLVGPDNSLYFIDFGQARWGGMDAGLLGNERGTVPYVAPEVARGEQEPTEANDVFALAATFAFVALGQAPSKAEHDAARLVEVAEHGVDLSALGHALGASPLYAEVLRSALLFDPDAREKHASRVARALLAI